MFIRIIAATSHKLEGLMEVGAFRQDRYCRINVLPIYLPALNARRQDLKCWVLADHFLFQIKCRLGEKFKQLATETLIEPILHGWTEMFRNKKPDRKGCYFMRYGSCRG